MSNKCPKCGSDYFGVREDDTCLSCGWHRVTVFQQITAFPEVLAEKLVYRTIEIAVNRVTYSCWKSTITEEAYRTKSQAIAATVARLKEVCDE